MGKSNLPQMNNRDMTCGGGFETWLQYVDGFELRHFCAFELLNDQRGVSCLADYQRKLVEAAVANGFGVINEGLHYRASRDWGELIGYSREALEEINIRGIEFYKDFAREYAAQRHRCLSAVSSDPVATPTMLAARRMRLKPKITIPNKS